MKIIPAIDIIGGKCVRLSEGKYETQVTYDINPLDLARKLEEIGFTDLHLVDLDGAKAGRVMNGNMAELVASNTTLNVDFGGGVKSEEDVVAIFNAGVRQVTIGSLAVKNRALFTSWLSKYGTEKFILGADVLNEKIAISAWLDQSDIDLMTFIQSYYDLGVRNVLCTDISKDGMLRGPSYDLYVKIMKQFPDLKLIASGGVSCIEDVIQLKELGIPAVVIGKAIFENKIDLQELVQLNG